MKVVIAQMNPVVGDISGNAARIKNTVAECAAEPPDLLVFPELFLTGYPPRDLLQRPWFIAQVQEAVAELIQASAQYPQTGILFGAALPTNKSTGRGLYNSALLAYRGQLLGVQHKSLLPTYDVFDEARYFDPAPDVQVIPFKDEKLGISVCEDAWNSPELWHRQRPYTFDPIEQLAGQGATLLINLSASPFFVAKEATRYRLIRAHARKHGLPFVYVNQIGANDELIFDGRSFCVDESGEPVTVLPGFREEVRTVDTNSTGTAGLYTPQDEIESVHDALVLGIRDYMSKCGFSQAVVGLSGGIDSAITCCLATQALGSKNVLGVSMPSPYSSQGSVDDSRHLAQNLGIEFRVIPISGIFHSYLETMDEFLDEQQAGIAEENIQARIRGNILMALSNKFGYLVLSTGNKSELAVGYCTLYGDMSGGLSVLADVPKTMVYQLAGYINRTSPVIPPEIIEKPPSAELKPDQLDQDTLPPYPILDQIIEYYVEEQRAPAEIIAADASVRLGIDRETVEWVVTRIDRNEYKRRQAPPGLKVTSQAFGPGRRMPIAAKYKA